jgi:hypothetical protein
MKHLLRTHRGELHTWITQKNGSPFLKMAIYNGFSHEKWVIPDLFKRSNQKLNIQSPISTMIDRIRG